MALPRSEWLHLAQRVPIGGKMRVRHGSERTCAMDVFNNDEDWSAYCHRCHEAGRVPKQHQRIRRAIVDEDRVQAVPADCLRLAEASALQQRETWALLCDKGCPPGVLPEEVLWYSERARRLILRSGSVALGRALDLNRLPKWLPFGEWRGLPMVWTTRTGAAGTAPAPGVTPALVLVEDALSAYKVAKAIDLHKPNSSIQVCATLGTRITDRFLPYCMNRTLVGMYDGDGAGRRGFQSMRQRLRVWGAPIIDRSPAKGDPKDMELADIFAKLEDIV